MGLGILLGGLGFISSAAGWCLLLKEREENRILREAIDVQLGCLDGALEKIMGSSEEIRSGLARAEEHLRQSPERGTAVGKAVHQASKDAHSTRRFCREFRRTLEVTRQTVAEEAESGSCRAPVRVLSGQREDAKPQAAARLAA